MRVLDGGRLRESGTAWPTAGHSRVVLQEHGQFACDGRRLTQGLPAYSWHCEGCGRVSPASTDHRKVMDMAEQHANACAATG